MKLKYFLFLPFLNPIFASEAHVDPNLLVSEIASRHPELQFYEAELEAARAGRIMAGLRHDPELSMEVGRKRAHDGVGGLAGEGTAWSVSLSQTFEWPGRIALRKAIANQEVALAELGLSRFKAALAARAQTLVYGLHAETTKAEAVSVVAERFRALKDTYLARDPAGLTPLLEIRVIEARELAIQRRATEAALALKSATIELNQLRGVAPTSSIAVGQVNYTFAETPAADALLAAARTNHFEYRARRLELEQQGFSVQLARNERYPSVTISPFFSEEKAGDRERVLGVGLSVPLPITNRARPEINAAEARLRQAEAAAQIAERELERELLVAIETFNAKRIEAARWSPQSVEKFREAAEFADRHFRLGAVPLTTYVELQNAYLEAVEALLDTQREAMEAGLRVQLLTGLDFKAVQFSNQ